MSWVLAKHFVHHHSRTLFPTTLSAVPLLVPRPPARCVSSRCSSQRQPESGTLSQPGSPFAPPPVISEQPTSSDSSNADLWERPDGVSRQAEGESLPSDDQLSASGSSSEDSTFSGDERGLDVPQGPELSFGTAMSTPVPAKSAASSSNWQQLQDYWGRMWYSYYNWRQDTTSDLQTFMLAFVGLVLFDSVIKSVLVDDAPATHFGGFLQNVYQVIVLSFGQEFPESTAEPKSQLFSVLVAGVGLASFAMVLTLVEQVVLEVIEENVRKGGRVYEQNHILVLGWCTSQRDLELVWKSLQQLCLAYRNDGGATMVVLTQRAKVEMEACCRRAIPEGLRYGSRFVFRQGSPLLPSDLLQVSAHDAAGIIVVSDQSRSPAEADAQSLRCAILLDELDQLAGCQMLRPPHVVIELKTTDAVPLLGYSCSNHMIPVSTSKLNARRLAKMVRHPVISVVSQQILNFDNSSNFYVQAMPLCTGLRFKDLAFWFPNAIVLGVVQASGLPILNPDGEYVVNPDDEIIMIRPTSISYHDFQPLDAPVVVPPQTWTPKPQPSRPACALPRLRLPDRRASLLSTSVHCVANAVSTFDARHPNRQTATRVVGKTFISASTTNQSPAALASKKLEHLKSLHQPIDLPAGGGSNANGSSDNGSGGSNSSSNSQPQLAVAAEPCLRPPPQNAVSSSTAAQALQRIAERQQGGSSNSGSNSGGSSSSNGVAKGAGGSSSSNGGVQTAVSSSSDSIDDIMYMVPTEYMDTDHCPINLLVCGWGEQSFMRHLIRELDHGSTALPPGSNIVFCNTHSPGDSLEAALRVIGPLENVSASHVRADPMQRYELSLIDMTQFKCAIVLCDVYWIDPDMNANNGVDELQQMDVLRLDSLVMVVQLHVRKILEDLSRPTINIICQKIGNEGITRFEDRSRLPLGICVNFTSYAAKLLSQVLYNPKVLLPTYGEVADLSVCDASELADQGETLTFWELISRAQLKSQVLLGYYHVPSDLVSPLETVINPVKDRDRPRVWNRGDKYLKFLVLSNKCITGAAD